MKEFQMKQLFYRVCEIEFVLAFIMVISSQTLYGRDLSENKSDNYNFVQSIESIKPGVNKDYVKKELGSPYKVSFFQSAEGCLYEQLSYLVNIRARDCSGGMGIPMVVEYNFIFKDNALMGVFENELVMNNLRKQKQSHLTIDMLGITNKQQ